MATNTYVALDTKTLSATTNTVTFTSIPQTYTDLVLVFNGTVGTLDNNNITFNGDTGANYSTVRLTGIGNGSTASASKGYSLNAIQCGEIGTTLSTDIIQIQNYSNTTTKKALMHRSGNNTQMVKVSTGSWRPAVINTSNITTMTITNGGTFQIGSTFTLYGIASARIGAPKAFGGTITQDATYTYHAFGASGTFIPQQSLTADILVVAGGGGGGSGQAGNHYGGGGGAGGLRSFTSQSLTATNYAITVGAGGAGGTGGATNNGANGGASSFAGLTATVGGGGGGSNANNGLAGGSGGGGGGDGSGTTRTGGAGTSGEGNAGGNKVSAYHTGGGGGAGAVGQNGSSDNSGGGAGGIGVTSSLINAIGAATGIGEFSSGGYYFAGGGGGTPSGTVANGRGFGGLGGGGNGSDGTATGVPFMPGTPNTGGGGGGGDASAIQNGATAGNGGSGAVIIRYLTV